VRSVPVQEGPKPAPGMFFARSPFLHLPDDSSGRRHPALVHRVDQRLFPSLQKGVPDFLDPGPVVRPQMLLRPIAQGTVVAKKHEGQRPIGDAGRRHQGTDRLDPLLEIFRVFHVTPARYGLGQALPEPVDPFPSHRHRRYHPDPEQPAQLFQVRGCPIFPGLIHHVEAENPRQTDLRHLEGEQNGPMQVLGVAHDHHRPGISMQEHVPGDPFVVAVREERVGSGAVQDRHLLSIHEKRSPGDLHGGTRIVGDGHVIARQRAEQRAFPHVWVAHQQDRPVPPDRLYPSFFRRRLEHRFSGTTCD